jgi:hypothetical protein
VDLAGAINLLGAVSAGGAEESTGMQKKGEGNGRQNYRNPAAHTHAVLKKLRGKEREKERFC